MTERTTDYILLTPPRPTTKLGPDGVVRISLHERQHGPVGSTRRPARAQVHAEHRAILA